MEKSRPVLQLRRSPRRRNRRAARMLLPRFSAVWLCVALVFAAMAMPIAGVPASATGSGYSTPAKQAVAARSGEGLGAAASDVITVTVDNYDKTIMKGTWFIKFYTDWCTHCQRLQPTWEEIATQMKGKVNVGQVNCDREKELCRRFHVRGYPTLVHVHNRRSRVYQKSRSTESLVAFATKGYKTAPAIPALKSPFGPLENAKAYTLRALMRAKDLVLEQVELGTPMWAVCLTAFALLVVTTVIVAVVVVTAKRPKQD